MPRLACLALILMCGGALAAEPKPTKPIPTLIEQLGDKDYAAREAAEKAIMAVGSEALPALRKAADHDDPEVRRRVARLIPYLERERVVAPKHVSLSLAAATPAEAFESLAKQTGYRIFLPDALREETETVKLLAGQLTFWEALDRVCRATGSEREAELPNSFEVLGKEERGYPIRLRKRGSHTPFVYYDGAFRVSVAQLEITRKAELRSVPVDKVPGGAGTRDSYCLTLDLAVEPRLLLAGVGSVQISEASDNEANSLVPKKADQDPDQDIRWIGVDTLGARRNCDQPLLTSLVNCSRTAKKVTQVKGSVPVILLTEEAPLALADNPLDLKNKKLKAGEREVTVHHLERKGKSDEYVLRVSIQTQNPEELAAGGIAAFERAFDLADRDGRRYTLIDIPRKALLDETGLTIDYQFHPIEKLGPPAKLIYHEWKPFRHEVKFAFKDVPLP
jgi:hypothetical protein